MTKEELLSIEERLRKEKIQWHTAPELPKVGDKCILVRDGEIDEAIWECQEDNPESPYMPWVTSTESDHYTTNYPRVNAWIRVKELDASHHEQFDNNRNLSQETANCDKRFNKILEMNTEAEMRRIAAMPMQASVRHLLRVDESLCAQTLRLRSGEYTYPRCFGAHLRRGFFQGRGMIWQ